MKQILLLLFFGFFALTNVQAQKYGFINSEFILSKMPEYKEGILTNL